SPGDREAIKGCRAPADLIENDKGPARGAIEDGGGLDHFDHEGRAAMGDIVGSADAGKQPVDDADMGAVGGYETAHLREDGDQCILAEEGRLTAHIGAGHEPELPAANIV